VHSLITRPSVTVRPRKIFGGVSAFVANGIKIIGQCGLGNDMPQIREGETVAAFDFMPTFRGVFESCAIDPNNRGYHDSKVEVIDDSMGIAGLAFAAANVLLDFLETRLDFPSGTIVLDDLLNREIHIGREEGNPLCFSKDPDHPDRTLEGFEHERL